MAEKERPVMITVIPQVTVTATPRVTLWKGRAANTRSEDGK